MDLQYVFYHLKTLSNVCVYNFFNVLVLVSAMVFICLVVRIYAKLTKIINEIESFAWEMVIDLHKATLTNDVTEAINLMQKCPEVINHLHPIDGYSPFMRACLNGNEQLVSEMLNLGADINLKSANGEPPLYLAVYYHIQQPKILNAACIRTLYYKKCDLNATNKNGYTALQLAAYFGHTSLVCWLLNKGASVFVQPSPHNIALSRGHRDTARLLRQLHVRAIE
ncbi:hypothetical protein FQR65_LT12124 [Abscondita terminalis]|nr:hypothetical protein FQR65_LT12124 [Abscondita terminalis]